MENAINSANENVYNKLATEALKKFDSPFYYAVNYYSPDLSSDASFCVAMDENQLSEVKKILEVCAARDISLEECFEESPAPQFLLTDEPDFYEEPVSVDLEKKYLKCGVKIALFYNGIVNEPKVVDASIMLADTDVIAMLEWQLKSGLSSYNDLYNYKPELFHVVNEAVRNLFSSYFVMPYNMPAFVVELTSVNELASTIEY